MSLPVLCFGAFAPLPAPLRRRVGEERAMFGLLGLMAAGLLLRAADPGRLLFAGT